ncbi:MAG: YaaA family protein [Nocardioidaceae bacterium]
MRRNALLPDAATAPAARIYTGVLYDALGLRTLSPAAKRRAASRLLVTSSLYGLVRPSDRIAAYRLSGDVSLPGLGTVASLWRPNLARALEPLTARNLLVDLRSTTYAAFWRPAPEVASRVVTLHVVHESDGARQVISHFNKATKGRLVRDLLEDGANPRTPAALAHALTRLGWTIEATPGGGPGFDVVVRGT